MDAQVGKKFWIGATLLIVILTLSVVGRNVVHAIRIKRQINALEREKAAYQDRIAEDSTLLEHLRYDEYLEEYAREHYRLQYADDRVYLIE